MKSYVKLEIYRIKYKITSMTGLFDLESHENKIKEYHPPLAKLNKVIKQESFRETL